MIGEVEVTRAELKEDWPRMSPPDLHGPMLCVGGLLLLLCGYIVDFGNAYSTVLLVAGALVLSAAALAGLLKEEARAGAEIEAFERFHNRKIRQMSLDVATGALSRRFFLEACEDRIRAVLPSQPLGYFTFDMDYLKTLNDTLGHQSGDIALRRLVDSIRASVGDDAIVGRLGGDEFAVLQDCASETEASDVAARFYREISRPIVANGREITLSATMGITLLPEHTTFLSEAAQYSDLALYTGKKGGRNRATLFSRHMLGELRQHHQIERELRLALENDELELRYLPVLDDADRLVTVRATVRWVSRWLGEIPDEIFVPIAERTNLVDRLGEWTIHRACLDLQRLDRKLSVSVELTAGQLRRDAFLDAVRSAIAETGIEPARLVVVVGHAANLTRQPDVHFRLRALHDLGVRISLDDISAIVSNFDQLRSFHIDVVRINAARIARLDQSDLDNLVFSSLVNVGRAMGLLIVAEGIATAEQWSMAREARCDRFAGPAISEALSIDALDARLQEVDGPSLRNDRRRRIH